MRPVLIASFAAALLALIALPAGAEESTGQAPAEETTEQAPAESTEQAPTESTQQTSITSVKAGLGEDREARADGAPDLEVGKTDDGRCIYQDLQGAFTITMSCDLVGNHTGHSQDHKRIWLASARGQLNIIEIPEPYRTAEFDHVMGNLARFWTKDKTPDVASPTQVAGIEAVTYSERHLRATTREWIFRIGGRNVIAKAVGYGKSRKEREAFLDELSAAWVEGFALNQ